MNMYYVLNYLTIIKKKKINNSVFSGYAIPYEILSIAFIS